MMTEIVGPEVFLLAVFEVECCLVISIELDKGGGGSMGDMRGTHWAGSRRASSGIQTQHDP